MYNYFFNLVFISRHIYVPQFLLGTLRSNNIIGNKNIGKTTILPLQHTILHISLKFLPDHNMILLNFFTIMESVSKQQQNFILFF